MFIIIYNYDYIYIYIYNACMYVPGVKKGIFLLATLALKYFYSIFHFF